MNDTIVRAEVVSASSDPDQTETLVTMTHIMVEIAETTGMVEELAIHLSHLAGMVLV